MDRQLRVANDICEQHMGDLELNFLFNLGSHLASHGNALARMLPIRLPRVERKTDSRAFDPLNQTELRAPPRRLDPQRESHLSETRHDTWRSQSPALSSRRQVRLPALQRLSSRSGMV